MSQTVHVIVLGARTPVGLTAESTAAAIRGRISRLREHPFTTDGSGEKLRCAMDARLPVERLGVARLGEMIDSALAETLSKLGGRTARLWLALPEPRPGHGPEDVRVLLERLAGLVPTLAGQGHAGALVALAAAADAVSRREVELALVGGVDSYHGAGTLAWLDRERFLAREGVRGGFPPGEAAVVLALASELARRQLGLPSLAVVRGLGVAQETGSRDSDEGLLGHGLSTAVRTATAGLAARIDAVYGDLNGERLRSDEWGFTIMRTAAAFHDATACMTAVGEVGDVGAAGGALGCLLAVQAWQRQYARGPHALVWGASWGGARAAVVLEKGDA